METKRTGGLRGALPSQAFRQPVRTRDAAQAGLLMKATQHAVEVCVLKRALSQFSSFVPISGKISQRHLFPQFVIFWGSNASFGGQNGTGAEQAPSCFFG